MSAKTGSLVACLALLALPALAQPTPPPSPRKVVVLHGGAEPDTLRPFGGSKSDRFNNALIDSMVNTSWFPTGMSDEDRNRQLFVAVTGLRAFKPTDEIEGMIATQAMAAHHAAMECSRRAMVPDQPFEAAQGLRKAAANASRTFVELLSALDRKRGKGGQQVVRVGPRTPVGLQRIVKARTVHGAYGAEMRELRRLARELRAGAKRLVEMT